MDLVVLSFLIGFSIGFIIYHFHIVKQNNKLRKEHYDYFHRLTKNFKKEDLMNKMKEIISNNKININNKYYYIKINETVSFGRRNHNSLDFHFIGQKDNGVYSYFHDVFSNNEYEELRIMFNSKLEKHFNDIELSKKNKRINNLNKLIFQQ